MRESGAVRLAVLALAAALPVVGLGAGHPAEASDNGFTISGFVVKKVPDRDRYDAELYLYYYLPNGQLQEQARTVTDEVGSYSMTVPARTYVLLATPYDQVDYPGGAVSPEWYGDTPFQELATPIVLTNDTVLGDIALEPPPKVSGQVVDEQGQPVPGAVVSTAAPGEVPEPYGQQTDARGRFSFWAGALYPFTIRVREVYDAFAAEYFLDSGQPEHATPLRPVVDTVLPPIVVGPGGSVAGTVTDSDGRAARHVSVTVENAHHYEEVTTTMTDTTGRYLVEALPPGSYTVAFAGGPDYDPSNGTPVTVVEHLTSHLDATLARRTRPQPTDEVITGRVLDAQGRPVRDVVVAAVSAGTPTDDQDEMAVVGSDVTDPDGIYRIRPDAPEASLGDEVWLYARDHFGYDVFSRPWPNGVAYDLVSAFHPGVASHVEATRLTVPVGTLHVPDLTLQEMGGIAGHVMQTDGNPAQLGEVYAYDAQGKRRAHAAIQSSGRYYLSRLTPGTYRLWFGGAPTLDAQGPFLPNWWQGGSDFTSATPVTVAPAQTVGDLDAEVVSRRQTVTGRFVGPDGRPVAGLYVNPQRYPYEDVLYVSRPESDLDGRFTTWLMPGQYKIRFGSSAEPRFRPLWWGGGTTYATGGVLTITAGAQTLDLGDVVVSPYPVLSGRLTGSAGERLARVRVQSYLADGTPVGSPATSVGDGSWSLRLPGAGEYRLGFLPPGVESPSAYFHGAPSLAASTPVVVTDEQQLTGLDEQLVTVTTPAVPPPTDPTVPPPSPLVTNVRARSKVRPSAHGRRRTVRLLVRVSDSSGPADGIVRVTEGGVARGLGATFDGRARIELGRLRPGRHTLVVAFLGGVDDEAPASTTITVRVPRPHRS